ncbi:MAG: SDR family oxidoreductase [Myxococcota bacterium]|nr:SDR family oxidoreductase [Myxococcota bacterium]
MTRRVAFVTGASRGIGKATVLALASAGFDIAATARTQNAGDTFDHMVTDSEGRPLPGSLQETAAAVRELGAQILTLPLDLLDRASMRAAVASAAGHFGRIDVLVNNAIYQGEGLSDRFLDGDFDAMERVFQGNVIAQAFLTREVLPHMLEVGSGTVINLTSHAGLIDPPYPVDKGGWSYAHGATKAGLHRMAGMLQAELGDRGIRAFNLEPGIVTSESFLAAMGGDARMLKEFKHAPVEVPAAVAVWLCTSNEAAAMSGGDAIHAQPFCKKRGLVPGWPPDGG